MGRYCNVGTVGKHVCRWNGIMSVYCDKGTVGKHVCRWNGIMPVKVHAVNKCQVNLQVSGYGMGNYKLFAR